jgi:hypothetical protein
MLSPERLAAVMRGHRKSLLYASTAALALAGAGSATAAAVVSTPAARPGPALSRAALATAVAAHVPAGLARPGGPHAPAPAPSSPRRPAAASAGRAAPAHPAALVHAAAHPAARRLTFAMVQEKLNWQTDPALAAHGVLPAADKLLPVPTTGAQSFTPIGAAQYQNATTIVRRALALRMGIRSAVVAVATAIQESKLLNLDYGSGDSLGLFQQQADCGWGTAEQIMDPAYAADAFLGALQQYQASNPDWAAQPLYQAAQAVQGSAFPYAYAQWETQAAQLVSQIVMQVR